MLWWGLDPGRPALVVDQTCRLANLSLVPFSGTDQKHRRWPQRCWPGNLSRAVYEYLVQIGFSDATDGGGMQDAAKTTGLAIVQ